MKRSKAYRQAAEKIDPDRLYTPVEAIALAKETVTTKFDPTVEVVALLLLGSVIAAIILRFRIGRPLFPLTLAELQKDREWLKTKTRNVE